MPIVKLENYTEQRFPVGENTIGYIIRGRSDPRNPNLEPIEESYHADCLLPDGDLVGYVFDNDSYNDAKRIRQKMRKGFDGAIAFDDQQPSYYKDVMRAIKYRIMSSILVIQADPIQVRDFVAYWRLLQINIPTYNRAFKNCSTLCYQAFKSVGLLRSLMPPITPKRLYNALLHEFSRKPRYKLIKSTGYFGVEKGERNRTQSHIVISKLKTGR